MAVTIDELQLEIKNNSTAATQGIDAFTASLERLRAAVKGGSGLTTVTKQLQAFSKTINGLNLSADASNKIKALVDTLKPLEEIQKSNLGSALNHLKKIPEITKALSSKELAKFGVQIRLVTKYVQPLAAEMEKVSQGFSKLPVHLQRAIRENEKFNNSAKKSNTVFKMLNSSVAGFIAKASLLYMGMKRIGNTIANWIMESNEYVENLNLFTASMGEYAESAQKYAEQVGDILGFDPSEWMRSQGIFMTLATGFGVAADKAALMSKNLTQLGYDLSSFFNIPVSEAMQKLQSGISGELEPLRRLGYDLSQAKLEAIALSQGIDKLVSDMTQAEKSQLRYYAILTQVTTAQGDMARTLEAPANQLRILQAQVTQAARALGNIFIPALNAVLPYAIAFMKVIRGVANEVANIFGFTLPEIDYSNLNAIGGEAGEVAGAFDDADDKAKELKKTLLGIDQINILGAQKAVPPKPDGGNVNLGINLPQYDFLGGLLGSRVNQIAQELEEPFKNVLKTVGLISVGMLGWKISTNVMSAIDWFKNNAKTGKIALGVTLALTGFSLAADGFMAIGKGDAKTWEYIEAALGSALGIGGSLLFFGSNPVGWAISIGLALTVAIVSMSIGMNKRITEMVKDAFAESGAGGVSPQAIIDAFNSFVNSQFGEKNKLVINLGMTVDSDRTALQNFIADMESLNEFVTGDKAVTQEDVEKLKSAWQGIGTSFNNVFGGSSNTILATFTESFSAAAKQVGKDAMVMRAEFLALSKGMSANMAAITAEAESLGVKIALGEYDQKDLDRYAKLSQAISGNNKGSQEFEKLLSDSKKIDFGKGGEDAVVEAKKYVGDIEAAAAAALKGSEQAYNAALEAANDFIRGAKTALDVGSITKEQYVQQTEFWSDYTITLEQTYNNEKTAIGNQLNTIFGNIQDQLLGSYDVQIATAFDKFSNMNGLEKFFAGGQDEYVWRSLYNFNTNVIDPVSTEIDTALTSLGITGSSYAKTQSQKIVSGLFDTTFGVGTSSNYFKVKLSQETIDILKEYGITVSPEAEAIGEKVGDAFWDGFEKAESEYGFKFEGKLLLNPGSFGSGSQRYTVQPYATGGFPVPGDLFYANEVAPEFVGSFGNKPAVANNGQIVEGIKRGVKEALQESSSNGGGGIIEMTFIMNDEEMARGTLKGINKLNKSSGRVLIPVDVM